MAAAAVVALLLLPWRGLTIVNLQRIDGGPMAADWERHATTGGLRQASISSWMRIDWWFQARRITDMWRD